MSYLVLARKFRPQTFATVVGQRHITKALANAIVRDRVPHALLFTGPRGVGKTSMARVFARALNCGSSRGEGAELSEEKAREIIEPCGECPNCKEIAKSTSLAVWEIDGASNNSVDDVRDLTDSLRSLPPPGSLYKVYIIDEVHMLSTAAFNALLKSLEEPPPNTIFIFATTEPHKIPETVISRCQRHDFQRLTTEDIASQLQVIADAEEVQVEPDVLTFLARRAEGGMRDAQSMFDRLLAFSADTIDLATAQQVFGVVDKQFFLKLSEAVFLHEPEKCFLLLDEVFRQTVDLRSFVSDFITHFRNLFLVGVSLEKGGAANDAAVVRALELMKSEHEDLKVQTEGVSSFDLQRLFDLAQKTADSALHSNYPRYVLEAGVAKMAALSSLRPLSEIISSLEGSASGAKSSSGPIAASPKSSMRKSVPTVEKSPPAQTIVKKQMEEPTEEFSRTEFNPSWEAFVAHTKSRSEHVLAAYLRRVTPISFYSGKLEMEANAFDLGALSDTANRQALESCLYSYSGEQKWSIVGREHVEAVKSAPVESSSLRPTSRDSLPAGSLAMQEKSAARKKREKIEGEAREQKAIKDLLSVFHDGKVEKVSMLKQ